MWNEEITCLSQKNIRQELETKFSNNILKIAGHFRIGRKKEKYQGNFFISLSEAQITFFPFSLRKLKNIKLSLLFQVYLLLFLLVEIEITLNKIFCHELVAWITLI